MPLRPVGAAARALSRRFTLAALLHAAVCAAALADTASPEPSPPDNAHGNTPANTPANASSPTPAPNPAPGSQGPLDNLAERTNLLGDPFGLRGAIAPYGLTLSAVETSELLGNPAGGSRQGALYEGLTDVSLTFDMRPYFHWRGVFYARALQIHGNGLSEANIGNLNVASTIEADRATRLSELWYEQHIGDWGRVRIGQLAADQEFIVSSTSRLFVNSTFGWPTLPAADLPAGGPAYPLASPGVRFRVDVGDALTFWAGLFDGNPTGAPLGTPDPQRYGDLSGTAFRVNDGALALAQIRWNPDASPQQGTYEAGAWFNSERFPDQHTASNGVSLASPLSNGMPRLLGNDYSVYAVVDQPLFRSAGQQGDTGPVAFVRAMGAPGDRNLVNFYFDTGLVYRGPFGRDSDSIGAALAYAQIGNAARLFDGDVAAAAGAPYPIRSRETVVELTYASPVLRWLIVQPDFQYISRPGGGLPDPAAPGRAIPDAVVVGVRTIITF